jgi:hypothetical protein
MIALLASTGALTSFAENFAADRQLDGVRANNSALMVGAWRSFAFVALAAGLGFGILRGRISKNAAVWSLAALMTVDLWTVERLYWMFSPPAKVIYASDPIIDLLKSEPQPVRVLAVPFVQPEQPDAFLTGDALMTHRIRNVLGYHGNQIGRYNDLTGGRTNPQQLFNPNVLQLTNTKYLLTNLPEVPFLPNVVLAKGPVRNASGDVVYLYRFTEDHPYSWLTPVAVKAPDDQVLTTVVNPRFDVKRAALFDTSARVRSSVGVQALPAPVSATTSVSHYEPGKVRIDLSAPAPDGASLVVSENYYPGWKATVDGKPAAIGRADFTFIGVDLPAGARTVQLDFTSPSYERGKVITWIAILLGFLMLGVGIWRDRRILA